MNYRRMEADKGEWGKKGKKGEGEGRRGRGKGKGGKMELVMSSFGEGMKRRNGRQLPRKATN